MHRKNNNLTNDLCLKLGNLSLNKNKGKEMSEADKRINSKGDSGQGERLNLARRNK